MSSVVERHSKLAAACRAAVSAWGLEIQCNNETEYSNAVTAVRVPEGINADELRGAIFDRFNLSLGGGLGKVQGKVFRIGHLGYQNPLTLMGALSGVEMGLSEFGVVIKDSGVAAAMAQLNT